MSDKKNKNKKAFINALVGGASLLTEIVTSGYYDNITEKEIDDDDEEKNKRIFIETITQYVSCKIENWLFIRSKKFE